MRVRVRNFDRLELDQETSFGLYPLLIQIDEADDLSRAVKDICADLDIKNSWVVRTRALRTYQWVVSKSKHGGLFDQVQDRLILQLGDLRSALVKG